MYIHIVSLFPEIFESFLSTSLIKKSKENGIIQYSLHNPRLYCEDKHQQIDDQIYGGGDGMLIKAKPVVDCIEDIIQKYKIKKTDFSILFPSPSVEVYNQKLAYGLTKKDHLIFVCGRYEGIDYRFELYLKKKYPDNFRKISLGQFIVLGGETPSMVMIESIVRLIPGVIKEKGSWINESYSIREGMNNLEAPNYTRPIEVFGMKVPNELLEGDMEKVKQWRDKEELILENDQQNKDTVTSFIK